MSGKEIMHEGVVKEIRDNCIIIRFASQSSCSSCEAKSQCSVSESEEKNLEVPLSGNSYSAGEKVRIIMAQSQGFRAIFLGYVLPFLIVIFLLILLHNLIRNEVITGLVALVSLVPYYLTLRIFRSAIEKRFMFRIMKM